MQRIIVDMTISYLVTIGAQLVVFAILHIEIELWQSLLIAAVFTIVAVVLSRFWSWVHNIEETADGHNPLTPASE